VCRLGHIATIGRNARATSDLDAFHGAAFRLQSIVKLSTYWFADYISIEVITMYFEQFHLGCLALDSYMLASAGEAVVVDPQRDVDIYLKAAEQHGVKITHIFETHLHADFVSGHKELAARTGAKIYIGPNGEAKVSHVEVHDGFEVRIGKIRISVLETPGHTPESICLVVTDRKSVV
jgi:glyoxylase-like metal-dependent hydrolase (beta-lactamase superfamily II)